MQKAVPDYSSLPGLVSFVFQLKLDLLEFSCLLLLHFNAWFNIFELLWSFFKASNGFFNTPIHSSTFNDSCCLSLGLYSNDSCGSISWTLFFNKLFRFIHSHAHIFIPTTTTGSNNNIMFSSCLIDAYNFLVLSLRFCILLNFYLLS